MDSSSHHIDTAFSRTLGWITEAELAVLKNSKVAIAGLGGVGGGHLLTLVRLGVGRFNLAEHDIFERTNFNRQAGAFESTCNKSKLSVLVKMALDINPSLEIQQFPTGLTDDNRADFLSGVNLFVDGLDIFAMDVRREVFRECYTRRIPALTVAPLGAGMSAMAFLPGKMSFQDYFRFREESIEHQILRFLLGISPSLLQAKYLVDRKYFNLKERKTPSTIMGCQLASGVAGTISMQILLNRGFDRPAPWSMHFDSYLMNLKNTYTWGGLSNPILKVKLFLIKKIFSGT